MRPIALAFALLLSASCTSQAMTLQGSANYLDWRSGNDAVSDAAADRGSQSGMSFWYRIPDWMAGTWQRAEETQVYELDCIERSESTQAKTFRVTGQFRYGLQQDNRGGIWHCAGVPMSTARLSINNAEGVYIENASAMMSVSPDFVTIASGGREVRQSGTGAKLCSWQQQNVTTVTPLPSKRLLMSGNIRSYGQSGNLLDVCTNQTVISQVHPFRAVNDYEGLDLRQLFRKFLKESGREDLIPAERLDGLLSST